MIRNLDIYRSAQVLVKRHGEDARSLSRLLLAEVVEEVGADRFCATIVLVG